MKSGWLLCDPLKERTKLEVVAQGLRRIKLSYQFRLDRRRMDLIVADLVAYHARALSPALQSGNQVMF